jgi:hypothetical protein
MLTRACHLLHAHNTALACIVVGMCCREYGGNKKGVQTYPSFSEPSSVSRLLFASSSSNSEPSDRPSEKASSPDSPEWCTPRLLGALLTLLLFFSLRFNFLAPRPSRADKRAPEADSSLPRRSSTDLRARSRTLSMAPSMVEVTSEESSPREDVRLVREGEESLSGVVASCLPGRSRDRLRELAEAPSGSVVAGIDLAVQDARTLGSR